MTGLGTWSNVLLSPVYFIRATAKAQNALIDYRAPNDITFHARKNLIQKLVRAHIQLVELVLVLNIH